VRAVDTAGRESHDSAMLNATPHVLPDEAFLDLVQRTAFDYFWYEANSGSVPITGGVPITGTSRSRGQKDP